MDWYRYFGDFQANLLVEGFFTKLSDPFVLTAPIEDPNGSGYLIQTRVNGSGAKVYGGTLEGKIAWRDKIQLQAGLTVQRSLYDSPEEWSVQTKSTCLTKNDLARPVIAYPRCLWLFYCYFQSHKGIVGGLER